MGYDQLCQGKRYYGGAGPRQRCRELCARTGVPERGIWEWGVVQTVSTAFVFLQIGQEEAGRRMLEVAACWSAAGNCPDESR